jgi:prephenate dehydrogenase
LNVAILGLGLIGGSIGLATRRGDERAHVVGFDPDEQALSAALAMGAIDEQAANVEQAVADADVVFAAAPVSALAEIVKLALRCSPARCVVSDVGSTKRALLHDLAAERGIERFVGGHPLAGGEQGGIAHARADLFAGATWCLLRAANEGLLRAGSEEHRERLRALIEGFGATAVEIDAEAHDRLMARISHLPHVLANVLRAAVAGLPEGEQALAAAGPSFRDATRVAGASTAIWTDIYLSNVDMVTGAIDEAIGALEQVRSALLREDTAALVAWNELARARRLALNADEAAG